MERNIREEGVRQVHDVRAINRDLTEKALRMRSQSYLAQVKAGLLTETIFEIDSSKKVLREHLVEVKRQKKALRSRETELSHKNALLQEIRRTLERTVEERTAELSSANEELRREIAERAQAEEERERLREQFYQAQKMESVGRLAGGVAHDFNNILSAILGYSELALEREGPSTETAEDLKIILDAAHRAAGLTRQLLAFSKKQLLDIKVVNVNSVIGGMARMLARLIGEDIQVELRTTREVANVKADVGQIEQVIMNLAVNARDAMPGGGRLVVETGDVSLDEAYTRQHDGVEPGRYVMLAVTDNGSGMPPEVLDRIFEPFYTTKERGTGLGLATVHGIVRQHSGHLYVYSEPGGGTTFKIYLPRTADAAERDTRAAPTPMARGTETVLVVDDEASIRKLTRATLQPLGYTVLEAGSGEEALRRAAPEAPSVDLLLTDLVLPSMSGRELALAFAARRPDVRVIVMSGYTGTVAARRLGDGDLPFIQKPITPTALAARIRQELDRPRR